MSAFSNELIEEIKVNISTILCEGLGINNKDYQKKKLDLIEELKVHLNKINIKFKEVKVRLIGIGIAGAE